jgi:hypothetical protein
VGGAHAATSLHQRVNGVLLRDWLPALRVLGLAADVGFVALQVAALATDGVAVGVDLHGLADAHAEEPSRAVAAKVQLALHLLGADTLLGGGHLVKGQRPLGQRQVRAFHYRLGGNGECTKAIVALEKSRPVRLAL